MLKQYFAFSPHTFVLGYKCYGFCLFKRQAMPTPGDTCSPLFAILNLLLFPLCAHMSLRFSSSLSFSSLILLPPHSLFPLSNKYSVLFCMMCLPSTRHLLIPPAWWDQTAQPLATGKLHQVGPLGTSSCLCLVLAAPSGTGCSQRLLPSATWPTGDLPAFLKIKNKCVWKIKHRQT